MTEELRTHRRREWRCTKCRAKLAQTPRDDYDVLEFRRRDGKGLTMDITHRGGHDIAYDCPNCGEPNTLSTA